MKYYVFQGRVDKIQPDRWGVLKQIEPSVEELTKEEYEERMGIGQSGPKEAKSSDDGHAMGADTAPKDEAPVYAGTKKELIAILKERGFAVGELNRKTKQQLVEML